MLAPSLLPSLVQTRTRRAASVLVVACGPVVFELPLRLQSAQIHHQEIQFSACLNYSNSNTLKERRNARTARQTNTSDWDGAAQQITAPLLQPAQVLWEIRAGFLPGVKHPAAQPET